MRPIVRGKNDKKFSDYPQARGDLVDRLGEYCSYCEMRLEASLHVEHVQPKAHHPKMRCQWDNLLLACVHCNSTKGNRNIEIEHYLWPDKDNTFLAFIYNEGGRITVNPALNNKQKECARNLLDLTGLDQNPGNNGKKSDKRWIYRKEAWERASRSLRRLCTNDTVEMREEIVEHAYSKGYWSIWMTVFKDDKDMLKRLIERIPGTHKDCFDKEGMPVSRKGGIV
jgi:uncharacterized protein (TIGR02646 family)